MNKHLSWRNHQQNLRHLARMAWYRSSTILAINLGHGGRTGTRPFWHGGAASSSSCASGSGGGAASSGSCTTASGCISCDACTDGGPTWLAGAIWQSAAASVRSGAASLRNGGIVGNEVTSSVLGNGGHCQRYHNSSRWTLAARTNGPNYDQQNGTSGDLQISIDTCISSMQLHSYLGILKRVLRLCCARQATQTAM